MTPAGSRQFRKRPRDGLGFVYRHPVHLRGRQTCRVRGVVDGRGLHHLALRSPGLDLGQSGGIAREQAVEHHMVCGRRHAGDVGGVVRPRHHGVDRNHGRGARALAHQPVQCRHGRPRIVERDGREAVEADQDDVTVFRCLWRRGHLSVDAGRERQMQEGGNRNESSSHVGQLIASRCHGERCVRRPGYPQIYEIQGIPWRWSPGGPRRSRGSATRRAEDESPEASGFHPHASPCAPPAAARPVSPGSAVPGRR